MLPTQAPALDAESVAHLRTLLPGLGLFSAEEQEAMVNSLLNLPPDLRNQAIGYLVHDIPRIQVDETTDYSAYADNPRGFGVEVFGENYTDDVIKVMESVRDYPVTIAESANAVGKTHGAARIAIWWYKAHLGVTGDVQVYTAAAPPVDNLSRLLWGEINNLVASHPMVFSQDRVTYLNISGGPSGKPRSFITGVAIPSSGTPAQREAKFSGKHASYLLFILDEADAIPPEVFSGIESCLSGGHGRLLCMYNPRSNEGPVAAMKERGVNVVKLSAFDHPNVRTGRDIIPGAVTRNKTIHRIRKWTVPATEEYEKVQGVGRFSIPEFLVGATGTDEETQEPYPPLDGGDRIIIEPEFSYMVLGEYPGISVGVIYDTWLNKWDAFRKELERTGQSALLRHIEQTNHTTDAALLPGWPPTSGSGNVCPILGEYEPGAGPVYWAVDDGYEGAMDPRTGTYTAESHPRVILMIQEKGDGRIAVFNEHWSIRSPFVKDDYNAVLGMGYPYPELVIFGPGSKAIAGAAMAQGLGKRTVQPEVEESIKVLRRWISADPNGWRRFIVHPRCKHFIKEPPRYRRNPFGVILKMYDHGLDAARYFSWVFRRETDIEEQQ